MKLSLGVSFETPGLWRKAYAETDSSEFPEAAHLTHISLTCYMHARLEQRLLAIRLLEGNLGRDKYAELLAWQDSMAETLLAAAQ